MKRKSALALLVLVGLIIVGGLMYLAFYHPARVANPNFANVSQVRALRVDYMDEAKSRNEIAALEAQMQQSGVNMVALSAGRADWLYFLWSGHSDQWSAEVKASGIDYLMEDSARFGKWAHVSAVIDVLAPLYIKSHPETAAVSWAGVPSQNLVSTTELVDGEFGKELLSMVSQIAADYPVNSITLTEMNYHVDGFGEKDKAAYIAYTSKTDWPRNADGTINADDPSIGAWRSYELSRFLEQVAAIIHQHNKQLFVEVRTVTDKSGNVIVYNGTDIQMLLKYADRIILRGNSAPDGRSPQAISALAKYASRYDQNRVILGIGLWNQDYYDLSTPRNEMNAIPIVDFQSALQAASQNGAADLIVMPSFLMTSNYWEVLKQNWYSTATETPVP
jgi:hypothetical protein